MATSETAATSSTTDQRHPISASDKQRAQLNKLFKDPTKPVFIPTPPKEKTLRPPREMMKNVQGSSAGAGSGEFHVYKANRRREYERIKLMEEQVQKVRPSLDPTSFVCISFRRKTSLISREKDEKEKKRRMQRRPGIGLKGRRRRRGLWVNIIILPDRQMSIL
jgi:hypothetical protein